MTRVSSWWPRTKGRTGSWSSAVARWRKVQKRVPSTIGWLRSRLRISCVEINQYVDGAVKSRFLRRKKHAGRAGHVAKPVKRGFRPGRPAERLFDLNRGEPGPERKPRKVKGMRCGPAGTCRPSGDVEEGMTRAALQVVEQDRYLAGLVEKQN